MSCANIVGVAPPSLPPSFEAIPYGIAALHAGGLPTKNYTIHLDVLYHSTLAPEWFYIPNVPPLLDGEIRRSYVLWREYIVP